METKPKLTNSECTLLMCLSWLPVRGAILPFLFNGLLGNQVSPCKYELFKSNGIGRQNKQVISSPSSVKLSIFPKNVCSFERNTSRHTLSHCGFHSHAALHSWSVLCWKFWITHETWFSVGLCTSTVSTRPIIYFLEQHTPVSRWRNTSWKGSEPTTKQNMPLFQNRGILYIHYVIAVCLW